MAKAYPVYEARNSEGKPCGHQHATQEKAENCAIGIAHREPRKTVTVRKYVGSENGEYGVVSHYEYQPPKPGDKDKTVDETLEDMVEELMS